MERCAITEATNEHYAKLEEADRVIERADAEYDRLYAEYLDGCMQGNDEDIAFLIEAKLNSASAVAQALAAMHRHLEDCNFGDARGVLGALYHELVNDYALYRQKQILEGGE